MTPTKKITTVDTALGQFQASASEVEEVIESYRELHNIYISSFEALESELDTLPVSYVKKINNAKKAFGNTRSTVDERQIEISNQLHAQGLVLLVGIAEAITKEMFRTLLIANIRKITIKRKLYLPLNDVLKAKTDEQLAKLVFAMLENEDNPSEKLNFQNMKQLQGIMKSYLDIDLDDNLMSDLHKFWQIRHIVIHNASIIDQQFINNLTKAKAPIDQYKIGKKVLVKKLDYERCFALLTILFETFDEQIEKRNLEYRPTMNNQ